MFKFLRQPFIIIIAVPFLRKENKIFKAEETRLKRLSVPYTGLAMNDKY